MAQANAFVEAVVMVLNERVTTPLRTSMLANLAELIVYQHLSASLLASFWRAVHECATKTA